MTKVFNLNCAETSTDLHLQAQALTKIVEKTKCNGHDSASSILKGWFKIVRLKKIYLNVTRRNLMVMQKTKMYAQNQVLFIEDTSP